MMVWLQLQGLTTETNQPNVELPVMFVVLYTLWKNGTQAVTALAPFLPLKDAY